MTVERKGRAMKRKTKITASSGNAFKDVALPMPEETLAKAELTARIAEAITSRGMTQAAAARILCVDQPKVSALLRGRLSGFSTERLLRFLTALGRDVDIVVHEGPGSKGHGHLQVVAA